MAKKKKVVTRRGDEQPDATEIIVVQNDVGSDVKKPVETIAVNPRSGKLTLLTRKLFNVLLYHAQEQGEEKLIYRLPLSEICSTAQFDSNDTSLVKEHLRKMNSTQVEWSSTTKSSRKWDIANLIASATITEGRGSQPTIVEWSYAPNVKEKLLKPDVYTRISLQFQSSLRSTAALALFEICTRYSTSPGGLTMREKWEWWRPRLTGVPEGDDDSHREYKYFKRDILKPTVTEVNQVTDLVIELIEHKNGRKVEDVQFKVARKQQGALALFDKNLFDMALLSRVMALGVPQREAEDVYANHEEGYLRATLDLTDKRLKQTGAEPISSPAAYFKQALRKKWAGKPAISERKVHPPAPGEKEKKSRAALDARFSEKRRVDAKAYFAELRDDDKDGVRAKFEAEVLPTAAPQIIDGWKKGGLRSKVVEVTFFDWIANSTWGKPTERDLLEFLLSQNELASPAP